MKTREKVHVVRGAEELAELMGLSPSHAAEWKVRSELVSKIIDAGAKSGRTHAEIAKAAGTSRTRVTAIMNRNVGDISTDLLLRVLSGLGYEARLSFRKVSAA
jgi:predicted XRE-type DNA-binding protein